MQLKNHDVIALRTICEQLPGFVDSLETVSQLRQLFVGDDNSVLGTSEQRIVLVKSYLDMFDTFISRYPPGPSLKQLQHNVVLKVARVLLRRPLEPGCIAVFGRLTAMKPAVILYSFGILAAAMGRRLNKSAKLI